MSAMTITESDLQLVLAQCDPEMRVAMLLSHRLGLRVAEVAAADFSWFVAPLGGIGEVCRVPAIAMKGASRQRRYLTAATLPMAADLRAALLLLSASRNHPMTGAILRGRPGAAVQSVTAHALAQRIKAIYIAAGMPLCSSHTGRRSLGTSAAKAMNLPTVASILRHSDLSSSLHYVQVADDATVAGFMRGPR
jgi:integrase